MTLGGLALAVGILVDDATVTIENIERNIAERRDDANKRFWKASSQIASPRLVSTLCICIVFLPMFFLAGVSKFLFVPLAEAVVFAMLASYFLSRTLVPTLAMYLLKSEATTTPVSRNLLSRFQHAFRARLRTASACLISFCSPRWSAGEAMLFRLSCWFASRRFCLCRGWARTSFPTPTTASSSCMCAPRAERALKRPLGSAIWSKLPSAARFPRRRWTTFSTTSACPYSPFNYMHSTSGLIGAGDADIMVSLKEKHHPTANYVRELRKTLPREFPGVTFYFLPADMVTQVLNFGLPAPIDIQIDGADIDGNRQVADQMLDELRHVPASPTCASSRQFDYPELDVAVDRTKAAQGGLHGTRCGQQYAEFPERKLSDHADCSSSTGRTA